MSQRAHLFSLSIGHALRATLRQGYSKKDLSKDLLAGITVGIISIPLAMALAIAVGVPPQYGLFTAIIGGFVIALSGGSYLSINNSRIARMATLGKNSATPLSRLTVNRHSGCGTAKLWP